MSPRLGSQIWGLSLVFGILFLARCSPLQGEDRAGDQGRKSAGRPGTTTRLSATLFKECKQLKELWLPESMTDLVWLRESRLEKLRAADTRIKSLRGLPASLRELDISHTQVQSLDYLPRDLRALDLRSSRVRSLNGLPDKLEYLFLSSPPVRDLGSLPKSLRTLYLHGVKLEDLSGLPRGLKGLHLVGSGFKDLKGLPLSLTFLALEDTRVESLKGLPASLQELRLVNNAMRDEGGLPSLLTDLTIERQLVPVALSHLNYLTRLSDRRDNPSSKLPPSLKAVTLKTTWLKKLPELPSTLRALGLIGVNFDLKEGLPSKLESLSLTSYKGPGIASLPGTVKRLTLHTVSFSTPPKFPDALEELQLIRTDTRYLENAPRGLKRLVICETNLAKLDRVKDRWPNLERLTICNSVSFRELGAVPNTLKALDVRGTSIARLPQLGLRIEDLNLSRTAMNLKNLRILPRSLRRLTLNEESVRGFEGFPPRLQSLRFCSPLPIEIEGEDEQIAC